MVENLKVGAAEVSAETEEEKEVAEEEEEEEEGAGASTLDLGRWLNLLQR